MTRSGSRQTRHALRTSQARRRQSFLFFTLLGLVFLTQMLLLRWEAEAIFFVTWFFLALTVQHDSRVSAAVGLAFLATSPFLLIAEKDAVAEQAANYAYFFLVIGVLVQLEELVMGRIGWLHRKLDLSYLWRPLTDAIRRHWLIAVEALRQQLEAANRTRLVRSIQIAGAGGLALVFLWAALSKASISILLPLLGGAILFPFVIWGLQLAVRAFGPHCLLRVVLAMIVLPLAALEMVWLHNLLRENRLARMETAYDFNDRLHLAQRSTLSREGEMIDTRMWTIEDESKQVLYQHPAFSGLSHLSYGVLIGDDYVMAFDVAMAPESWQMEGDGAAFALYVEGEQGAEEVFSTYIDPKNDQGERRWHPHAVDLAAYAGQTVTITFETGVGPAGDERYDWAGWGEPRLVRRVWP